MVRYLTAALAAALVAGCSLGGCSGVDRRPLEAPPVTAIPKDPPPAAVDLESKPLARIPAGTVVGTSAPEGWTHLVLIATPTLTDADLRDAPKIATHYARMLKFTLLAKVGDGKSGKVLESLARGFAVDIAGKDTVIETGRVGEADLGAFGARILAENEKILDEDVRQIVRTPTLLVFDAKAVMRRGDDHVRMTNRHAVIVDPATGALSVFVWLLEKSGDDFVHAEKTIQLLPADMREARLLSVKRDRFVLGLPTRDAFALVRIPQGRAIVPDAGLAPLVAAKYDAASAAALEKELRKAAR